MGTTGTITGVSKFLKQMNPSIEIIGMLNQKMDLEYRIRRWKKGYEPKIKQEACIDYTIDVSEVDAQNFSIKTLN